ncbi:hypothetical protein [Encephalitozoon cuniculi GB-M1]|uniref:Golgin subfamily A member 7/ERF4 domain-containing protein n=1 Tax=Encephalitozoon cuniculi (strain GB-M1) TaxID=284813 RepID=Q8SU38_ENCCU|nr:uncharacterized protein ECU11_1090 [Encephalitozoon cuniculi GB-M1]CAD26019.2 hypothetical protein [Encephalitozoon cuniculi GB-M1]
MRRKSVCIQIPRDPRTDRTSFITEMPEAMSGRIEEPRWKEVVSGLNDVLYESESPSLVSFVKTISIIPLLVGSPKNVFARVEEYLSSVNKTLEGHGIQIVHPGYHQYVELEVEMCQEE